MSKPMWELLVPTVKPNTGGEKFFKTRYHRVWDDKVRSISGGLTIMPPGKGQWVSPHGVLFQERMIPVRIIASREEIEEIMRFTMEHYSQEAVLCYKVSDEVILMTSAEIVNAS